MLNKNIEVLRPKGTKIYKQRECRYVYHVTGSSYKKEKQYVVESLVCVGKMIINQTSVMQHYPAYAWNHLISSTKIWSDCEISEFLKKEFYLHRSKNS